MPELPEVETIARELRPLVVGSTITGFWTDWPKAIKHPDPERFERDVLGHTIYDVARRAKWLVLSLGDDLALAIQVKMTGQLFVLPADAPRDAHVHVAFGLDGERQLRLRDVRKFGRVGLYRRDESGTVLGADEAAELFEEFGPEPLDENFTLKRFRERIRGRRARLKPLLVDQAFLAGVGNIYADEALWRARLHPLRSAATLGLDDERRLYQALREVLIEAVSRRGSSVDDYIAPEGQGEMQQHLDVYQRTGEPCRRCGRPLKRIVIGIRSTHFCSWCQRLTADDRTAGNAKLLAAAVSKTRRRGRRWSELPTGEGAVGAEAVAQAGDVPGDGAGLVDLVGATRGEVGG